MNKGYTFTEIVDSRGEGWDLQAHLALRYGHSSRDQWRERIEGGLVLVDGARAEPGLILRRGQRVTWTRPPWLEPEVPRVFAVLYEDESLLAVAKPSGLPTMPGGGYLENTLLSLVRRRTPRASPAHRLGRGTSGLVLFTLDPRAASTVAEAWRARRVVKTYRALVEGCPFEDTFPVEDPIDLQPHPLLGAVYAAHPGGKAARSFVRVLQRREGESLVEVEIETGRPHQIRIHMAACGHPLVGDPLYAPGGGLKEAAFASALPGDLGYLLHAWRLALPHPATGSFLEVECRPPGPLRMG